MKSIELSYMEDLNGDSFEILSLCWQDVEDANFTGCVQLDDRALEFISRSCVNLKRIILNKTSVTEKVKKIPENFKSRKIPKKIP